jgi:hypothetical protein
VNEDKYEVQIENPSHGHEANHVLQELNVNNSKINEIQELLDSLKS